MSIATLSRAFAIKSHNLNKDIETDIIIIKAKPNPENDDYFYDDEPKDWYEFGFYPNKLAIGKAKEVRYKDDLLENQLLEDFPESELKKKIDFLYNKPAYSSVISSIENNNKLNGLSSIVRECENQPGFFNNLTAFLNILGITTFP